MKPGKKINREWTLKSTLSLAGFLAMGLSLATPALAEMDRQALDKTVKQIKDKLEHSNTGRDISVKHLQKSISTRSQTIKKGTDIQREINKSKQGVVRNIR